MHSRRSRLTNHVHLIVEAKDRAAVIKKMSGFMISFAKRLNLSLGRKRGKVWGDRYYRADIDSGRQMRNVLAYVFGNAKKHGVIPRDALLLDGYSSAWTFDGWNLPIDLPPEKIRWKPPKPRTDLLRRDWIAFGLLRVSDAPKSAR